LVATNPLWKEEIIMIKKILLSILLLLTFAVPSFSATYYGVRRNSNWNSGSWSTTATKDATRTGSAVTPTATDDCILDDWTSMGGGVVWTVNATTCVCKTLTMTGYAGDLAFTAGQTLGISGNITFANTHTLSGTGTLQLKAAGTITMAGLTFPGSVMTVDTATYTLAGDLNITGNLNIGVATPTFAGAYNITCAAFYFYGTTLTLVSGQTLTVSTTLNLDSGAGVSVATIKSSTASSDTYLHFNGLASASRVVGMTFTDVNAAHALDNWYGGTLTRTTGITNRTSADIGGVSGGGACGF
jgi:hypothetical protein